MTTKIPLFWASGKPLTPEETIIMEKLRGSGCKCGLPLLGSKPGVGPRCRLCGTQVNDTGNWFFEEPHPTDEYVHWTELAPRELSVKLRKAWNRLGLLGELEPLKVLLDAAYHAGQMDEHDSN